MFAEVQGTYAGTPDASAHQHQADPADEAAAGNGTGNSGRDTPEVPSLRKGTDPI